MQGTPSASAAAAATPVPQPALAPRSVRSTAVAHLVDNSPTAEARSALAKASGLVHQVEKDLVALLDRIESAYHAAPATRPPQRPPLETLSALISLLSRSALGGFVPPPSVADDASAAAGPSAEITTISQAQTDDAQARSQALFKQLQSIRERAEVVRAGLAR
ncbi:hypothetical protein JCM3774_005589 [Rhodotorula dairenensis]